MPICDHRNIKGHAVRAAYLLSGATDVAAETQDPALLKMINRVWRNTTQRNMYITGGIGPSASNEGFTHDYDLPNLTAYQETCASVALAQWNHRLALLYGDARFADVFERSLYNGVLAGVSLDGKRFFYVNPLESQGKHHRSPWFGCACCPPNVARTLASLGGYAYAVSDDALWVNLYIQGSAKRNLGGRKVHLNVETDYPWDGKVTLKPQVDQTDEVRPPSARSRLVPGRRFPSIGEPIAQPTVDRGYIVLAREWKDGDVVELNLPMPVERIAANPNVKDDVGQLAIQRGPLVYCLEACDQGESAGLASVIFPERGAEGREGPGPARRRRRRERGSRDGCRTGMDERLYQAVLRPTRVPVTAIPYYAWDNRKAGPMKVWLPTGPANARKRRAGSPGQGEPVVHERQLPALGHQRRPRAQEQRRAARRALPLVAPFRAATSGPSTPGRRP